MEQVDLVINGKLCLTGEILTAIIQIFTGNPSSACTKRSFSIPLEFCGLSPNGWSKNSWIAAIPGTVLPAFGALNAASSAGAACSGLS